MMDSIIKSKYASLSQAFGKIFGAQLTTEASPDEKLRKCKSKNSQIKEEVEVEEEDGDEFRRRAVDEVLIAKTFSSISSIKAAYSQFQLSESPFDAEGIQSSDELIVSEMQNLSQTRQCYYNQMKYAFDESPQTTLALSEIKEHKCHLKMHQISLKKLDSELKAKDSAIILLKEKLARLKKENKSLEMNLSSSGQLQISDNNTAQLNALKPTHFIACLGRALRSITSFVRLMTSKMESAKWDLNAAANAIEPPRISFQKQSHIIYAFESFVCRVMFEGFDSPNFSIRRDTENQRTLFFNSFLDLKSVGPGDCIASKPESDFATFCREKYSKLIHQKMEVSLFGDLKQRRSVMESNEKPNTPFLASFVRMAKRVWLLQCLAFSYSPEVSIFRVSEGTLLSEAYMESLNDGDLERDHRVAFTVVPGFKILNTIVQCKVYLSTLNQEFKI